MIPANLPSQSVLATSLHQAFGHEMIQKGHRLLRKAETRPNKRLSLFSLLASLLSECFAC